MLKAAENGQMETLRWLLRPAVTVAGVDPVDADMGYLPKDEHVAASAFQDLAGFGDLELMKRVLKLYPNFEDDDTIWLPYWGEAQQKACISGDLELVTWLVEHPIGRKKCEQLKETRHIDHLLQVAAAEGHIKVVECLQDQGAVDISGNAMLIAVRKGHTKVVEVLQDPNWYAEKGDAGRLTHQASLSSRR
ncbi:hypothetical protein PHYSODRAFT_307785 [Phytophthora sojae]|uniref:Uncharacterized protein n=1 Tax=Phytophthora sojae (strain P6497) TaxID=1094619 RepID=G5AG22_PHYSP|nr:hypothetical protein PHYSODRAFT_307785 [Phytophthora sojae]EGZ05534.1 hypothetical protein PHYSODRAFT_307785 [Phytophthora sojae]|eukprot:XP_009539065.1 hypothetical protein PHYSODRAFT_307785 [Phytophthora sojae]